MIKSAKTLADVENLQKSLISGKIPVTLGQFDNTPTIKNGFEEEEEEEDEEEEMDHDQAHEPKDQVMIEE